LLVDVNESSGFSSNAVEIIIGFEELIESKEGELITNDFYDIEMRYCNTFTIDSNGIIVQANLIS